MLKKRSIMFLYVTLLSLSFAWIVPSFADESASNAKSREKSAATASLKPQVDKKIAEQAIEKQKKIVAEASTAIKKTESALTALEEGNASEAMTALEAAIGKLELILARDPELALAPVDVDVMTYDLFADLETIREAIDEAEDYLEDGEIQNARALITTLASEIVFRTTNIPLATYPGAIKEVIALIDDNKIDQAKVALQTARNTLVITEEIIPLPAVRAKSLLENTEELAKKEERSVQDNEALSSQLDEARTQLKMAELLGYGSEKDYASLHDQIDQIEQQINGDMVDNWFDEIKQELSDLF